MISRDLIGQERPAAYVCRSRRCDEPVVKRVRLKGGRVRRRKQEKGSEYVTIGTMGVGTMGRGTMGRGTMGTRAILSECCQFCSAKWSKRKFMGVPGLLFERLSFYHNGIARRLTDVHGRVLKELLNNNSI